MDIETGVGVYNGSRCLNVPEYHDQKYERSSR